MYCRPPVVVRKGNILFPCSAIGKDRNSPYLGGFSGSGQKTKNLEAVMGKVTCCSCEKKNLNKKTVLSWK